MRPFIFDAPKEEWTVEFFEGTALPIDEIFDLKGNYIMTRKHPNTNDFGLDVGSSHETRRRCFPPSAKAVSSRKYAQTLYDPMILAN